VLKKKHGKRNVTVEYRDEANMIRFMEFSLDGLGENQSFLTLLKSAKSIETIHTQETTLEKIFIKVTGQELDV